MRETTSQVRRLPVHPIAVLVGLAAGWQWSGMRMVLACTLDPLPATSIMLGAVALLSAALGPWLPERVVATVDRFLRRRRQRDEDAPTREAGTFWILRAIRDRDESLLWLALSLMAAVAAVLALLTLAAIGPVTQLHGYLLDRFFWTNLTLTAMEWLGTGLLIGPLWLVNGLVGAALVPVVRARYPEHRRAPGVIAGVLIGVGLAWVCHEQWADRGLSGNQEVLIGVLPMFVLAGCAARLSQLADRKAQADTQLATDAPEVAMGAEGLIWVSLVVWGIGSVLVGAGWFACQSVAQSLNPPPNQQFSWYLLVLGVGVAAASFHAKKRKQSASGCGMALWAAGIGAGAAATWVSFWPTGWTVVVLQMLTIAVPMGYALHYAERAWLVRIGSETLGIAQLSSALLAGSAIGMILGHGWVLPRLGPMGLITSGSLLMLAFGGLMQIYEQDRPTRTQRQRLALIFGSLAAAIVLFPSDTKSWTRWERRHTLAENPRSHLAWLKPDVAKTSKLCLIGVEPREASSWLAAQKANADVFPWVKTSNSDESDGPTTDHARIGSTSAFRALRLNRRSYGLIYQWSPTKQPLDRFAQYSAEWFARMADRTAPGGQILIDVPLAGTTTEVIRVIATTFEHVMGPDAAWTMTGSPGNAALRLRAAPDPRHPLQSEDQSGWYPITQLADGGSHPRRLHSIQQDQMTRFWKTGSAQDASSVRDWLEKRRSESWVAGPP